MNARILTLLLSVPFYCCTFEVARCADTVPDCKSAAVHPVVEIESLTKEAIHTKDPFSIRVTLSDTHRHLSRVQMIVDGQPNLEFKGQQISSLVTDGQIVHIPVSVKVGDGDSGQLRLPPEKNDLSIRVFAYDNSEAGNQVGCGVSSPVNFRTPKLGPFAVVLGFNYQNTQYQLNYAQKDAEDIVKHLVTRIHLKPENVYLVTDDAHAKDEMKKAQMPGVRVLLPQDPGEIGTIFDRIFREADADAVLYFYFSGHQFASPANQSRKYPDRFYVMLWNSDVDRPRTMYPRKQLLESLVDDRVIAVSIMDACYSGPPVDTPENRSIAGRKIMKTRYTEGDLDYPATSRGLRISSSDGTEPSWEFGGDINHGVFTFNLLKEAQKPGPVTLGEALKNAKLATVNYKPPDANARALYKEVPHWNGDDRAEELLWVAN